MDITLTTYEALDLMVTLSDQLDSIFGYWISTSFAMVVGIYVAKEHLNFGLAMCIGVLYLIASMMFGSRWIAAGSMIQELVATKLIPENYLEAASFLPWLRVVTFTFGCVVTEGYLVYAYRTFRNEYT